MNLEILILDDDPLLCISLKEMVASLGYDVVTFSKEGEALHYFAKDKNPVFLLDINLTTVNGLDLLPRIKEINPKTQIIMMSGDTNVKALMSSLTNRATDFLIKPFTIEAVNRSLKNALKYYTFLYEKEVLDESIERDLRVASKIQEKLFFSPTSKMDRCEGDVVATFYVSGDYFQVLPISNEVTYLLLGDIEGHGVTSGLIAFYMSILVRDAVRENSNLDSKEVLELMNSELVREIGTHSMTATVIRVEESLKQISYSRAAHPYPILFRKNQKKMQFLNAKAGSVMGVFDSASFQKTTESVEKGDILLLYSDGLIDSPTHPLFAALEKSLEAPDPYLQILETVKSEIASKKDKAENSDDISYLLYQI